MDAAATRLTWLVDADVPAEIVRRLRTEAEACGLVCSVATLEQKQLAAPRAVPRADAEWQLFVTARTLSASDLGWMSCCDDGFSVADRRWEAEARALVARLARISHSTRQLESAFGIVGSSPAMIELRRQMAHAVLDAEANVLILGETGTGKRVVAEALHRCDERRAQRPFHCLDAGATVAGLFGSELFGHVRGAFTGANESRPGAIRTAADGTLLLDEIGELPLPLQASLLTVLQERLFRSVGSDRDQKLECRIISATHRDLDERVRAREFREDLRHRLSQIVLRLPALRERPGDIATLARSLVRRLRPDDPPECSGELLEHLQAQPWPGNVRELEAGLRYAVVRANGSPVLRLTHLPASLRLPASGSVAREDAPICALEDSLAQVRRDLVRRALRIARDTLPEADRTAQISWAAERLAISPRSVYNYIGNEAR